MRTTPNTKVQVLSFNLHKILKWRRIRCEKVCLTQNAKKSVNTELRNAKMAIFIHISVI